MLQRIYLPEEYRAHKKEFDVALLELETPVQFNDDTCESIKPACLYQPSGRQLPALTIIGFGQYNASYKSDWLLKGTVTEIPLNECRRKFDSIPGIKIGEAQICAHDLKYDTCQGN